MKIIYALLAALALTACTDANNATRTLVSQGYTEIRINGYALLSCGENDTYATAFTAKGPNGKPVSGAVCAGVFKGNTVRLD